MLIIEDNSVYEIDENCAKRKKMPKECGIYEKLNCREEKINIREKKEEKKDNS